MFTAFLAVGIFGPFTLLTLILIWEVKNRAKEIVKK